MTNGTYQKMEHIFSIHSQG